MGLRRRTGASSVVSMASGRLELGQVGLEALLRAELQDRRLHGFLPQQRIHGDVQRVVLDRQSAEALLARAMMMHGPSGGGQMQVPRFPFEALAQHRALAVADEVVVDRRGDMAMR